MLALGVWACLLTSSASALGGGEPFRVPEIEFESLIRPLSASASSGTSSSYEPSSPSKSDESLRTAIAAHGVVAVTDVPNLKDAHESALRALSECRWLSPQVFTDSLLPDMTVRSTLAAETRGFLPRPLDASVRNQCPQFAAHARALRLIVGQASRHFIRGLDRVFGPIWTPRAGFSGVGGGWRGDGNAHYASLEQALSGAQHLDHFHAYQGPPVPAADRRLLSVDFHTDDGLFIALAPALTMAAPPSSSSTPRIAFGGELSAGRDASEPSGDFLLKLKTGEEVEARMPQHSIVFVLGSGIDRWTRSTNGMRTGVPHAVRVPANTVRAWFGRMFLPPSDAFSEDIKLTFEAYRDLQLHQSPELVHLGCSPQHGHRHEQSRSPKDLSDANCAEGEFHCWMRCYPPANASCGATKHLECLSNSSGKKCDPEQMGCGPVCVESDGSVKDQAFCNRNTAVSMYMEGFISPGNSKSACVILLFQGWVLDTKAKFVTACLGVVFAGIFLEGLIGCRRMMRRKGVSFTPFFLGAEALTYGLQTCLGYMLMLVAMTFSSPLFAAVIVGLVIGHILFSPRSPVSEGATPCCEGTSLPSSKEDDRGTHKASTSTQEQEGDSKESGEYGYNSIPADGEAAKSCCGGR